MAFNINEFLNLKNQQWQPNQPKENNSAVDALGSTLLTQNDKNDMNMVGSLFGSSDNETSLANPSSQLNVEGYNNGMGSATEMNPEDMLLGALI